MKTEFLKSLGLDEEVIAKIQAESGKDIQAEKDKFAVLEEKLSAAQREAREYNEKLRGLEDTAGDTEALNQKIKELQEAISAREQADKEAATEADLRKRFQDAKGGADFLNDFTENGIFREFQQALSDAKNAGKSDANIYAELTRDRDGLFANAHPPADIPGAGTVDTKALEDNEIRRAMGLPIKE